MMHRAYSNIEQVPYYFSRSSVKFQRHTAQKMTILTRIEAFRTVTSVLIRPWLWNHGQSLMSYRRVPYCFPRSSMKFQGHTGQKNADFAPNWAFPDFNSSLNSLMDLKWCTKLDVVRMRCSIVFQGHSLNCKLIRDKKSAILNQIERFRTVTAVWVHRWIWNDAQREVIREISR